MDQRIAPTSPKHPATSSERNASTKSAPAHLGVLAFASVILISIIGGAAGMLLILTQSSRLGLNIFKDALLVQQQFVSRSGFKEYQDNENILEKRSTEIASRFVFLYVKQSTTQTDSILHLPQSAFRGVCAMLTEDGICMTPISAINSLTATDSIAMTTNGEAINIREISKDEQAGLAYVTLEKGTGNTIDIADVKDSVPHGQIDIVVADPMSKKIAFDTSSLQWYPYGKNVDTQDYIVSSDMWYSSVVLSNVKNIAKGSLIERPDGVVLGLFDGDADASSLIWMPERKNRITEFLKNRTISYASLGLNGVDLLFVPVQQKAKDYEKGFLLASTKDGAKKAVTPKSAAAKAGLREGDIITAINKQKIQSVRELPDMLREALPNTDISISFLRDGKSQEATVRLSGI